MSNLIQIHKLKISQLGIELLHHFESCKLVAYKVGGKGNWTIGWGNETYLDGSKVKEGDTITQQQADTLFSESLPRYESMVRDNINRPLQQQEFDALCSFAYNAGTSYRTGGSWRKYAIWDNVNKNIPFNELKLYWEKLAITSGGVIVKGLQRRRKAEAHLFGAGELKFQ